MGRAAEVAVASGRSGSLRGAWSLGLLLLVAITADAQSLLDRRVTVHAENVRLATALSLIAKEGGFNLSYNAAVVPADSSVTLKVEDMKVDRVLRQLLPVGVQWKGSGAHLIITGEAGRKQRFITTGSVIDASNGKGIVRATVFEVRRSNAVITSDQGEFSLDLSGELDRTPLRISRHGYRDTIVFVMRDAQAGRIALEPLDVLERIEPLCVHDRCGVEDLGMARLLVPTSRMDQAANLDFSEKRDVQLSLIPTVGTNGAISGSVVNHASFNVIGGYARGVEGVEVGGVINLLSHDMSGVQVGGLANLVGGHTNGVQIGGAINHSMRSLEGLQIAGFGNTVWDTLSGVQIAGGANIVKRGMTGTQLAAGANIALGDLDGVQVAGGVNVAHGSVNKAQVAGGINYARSVTGGQVAAGVNVALGEVGGGQVGFGANYARSVSGGQVSFGLNIVPDSVSGGQVGFGANYAGHVSGGQFSFGLNVVPGTVSGAQVGALNFARRAHGGQVGFINLSDTVGGAAVGLLTISLKGYHRFDVLTGDVMAMSLHIRTGTRGFHNILGYSPPVTPDERWGFLYGIGTEPRIGRNGFFNIDLTGEQVVEQAEWVDAVNILGRLSLRYGHTFARRITVSAGPLVNMLVTDWRDPESGTYLSALPPATPPMQWRSGTTLIHGWFGWMAGVGVRF
jgi:hypothetical protein